MKRERIDLRDLKERMREIMRKARQDGQTSRTNVAGRVNKAVVVNTGGKGTRRTASSRQRIRIKQDPGGTIEEVETRETRGD